MTCCTSAEPTSRCRDRPPTRRGPTPPGHRRRATRGHGAWSGDGAGMATEVEVVEELGADAYVYGSTELDGERRSVIVRVDGRTPAGQGCGAAPGPAARARAHVRRRHRRAHRALNRSDDATRARTAGPGRVVQRATARGSGARSRTSPSVISADGRRPARRSSRVTPEVVGPGDPGQLQRRPARRPCRRPGAAAPCPSRGPARRPRPARRSGWRTAALGPSVARPDRTAAVGGDREHG